MEPITLVTYVIFWLRLSNFPVHVNLKTSLGLPADTCLGDIDTKNAFPYAVEVCHDRYRFWPW